MPTVQVHEKGYDIQNLKEGESCLCPDNDTQIEKIDPDSVKITLFTGKIKKI